MKPALGRGLDALIPKKGQEVLEIELQRIAAGVQQPRKVFKDDALRDLASSIKEKGVLQPVLLQRQQDGSFSIIAGERRVRASRMAGLTKIPAIIKDSQPEDALEISIIENIQREDLGPIETANAFEKLITQFGLTQEELSKKVGKERATVANYLRLLKLPDDVKKHLDTGVLSMGHGRAIASLDNEKDQKAVALRAIKEGLSVRETERLCIKAAKHKTALKKAKDPDVARLEERLKKGLATKVSIRHKGKRGIIQIEYYSLEELDRLIDVLLGG